MDDVERLFECFKCGISPPQSAVRVKKRSRRREGSPKSGCSLLKGSHNPESAGESKQLTPDVNPKLAQVTKRENKYETCKKISPVVFYGSPHGVPPKRPSSLLRLLREIHLDLAEKDRSKLRNEVWATFPKQEEAMKFVKRHKNIHIFSYQDHFNGQRRFLASSYDEFWQRYKHIDPKFRHHYEVIQEGLPCHLYFDLEFNKNENMERDGDAMVDLLVSVTFDAFLEKYGIKGELDWIVELDSSTKEKFSRHLVIRVPKAAFKDNSHVGAFVAEICSRIHSAREKGAYFEQLFITKISSSSISSVQLFVDDAVYSRNRCFRLALSSKAGKCSLLLPTGRFRCKDMGEEDIFFASLIGNIDCDCEKLLVCKMELDCVKTLRFDTEVNYNDNIKQQNGLHEFRCNISQSDSSSTYCVGKSPFPDLDAFIESVASSGNCPGKIRCWYWFSEYSLMIYSMSRNRYCERIGREHKSNHVMYIVDVKWALYYQKCYDPDCRGYRSPSRPVPSEVIPESFSCGQANCSKEWEENMRGFSPCDRSDNTDGWWLEAIEVANTIENGDASLNSSSMNYAYDEDEDEDEDWWMEVEKTTATLLDPK